MPEILKRPWLYPTRLRLAVALSIVLTTATLNGMFYYRWVFFPTFIVSILLATHVMVAQPRHG